VRGRRTVGRYIISVTALINLHSSLLPAFKGNDAWEYIAAYGARFTGSTVEFIHERMDEGKIILQTVCPWDDTQPEAVLRHRGFVQQCRALLQLARWLAEGRVRTDGCRVLVQGARFDNFEFSPALDFDDAMRFERAFRASLNPTPVHAPCPVAA